MKSYTARLSLSDKDKWLHQMPGHWKGGFDFLLAGVYAGARVEFAESVFSPEWFWERISCPSLSLALGEDSVDREGGITCFLAAPGLLSALKEILDARAGNKHVYEAALAGLRGLRLLLTGSMRVPESLKEVWRDLLGKEVVNMYGFTEASGMVSMTDSRQRVGPVFLYMSRSIESSYTKYMLICRITAACMTLTCRSRPPRPASSASGDRG